MTVANLHLLTRLPTILQGNCILRMKWQKLQGGGGLVRPALPVWLPYQPWQSHPASWKQIAYLDAAQLSHWPVSLEFYFKNTHLFLQLLGTDSYYIHAHCWILPDFYPVFTLLDWN